MEENLLNRRSGASVGGADNKITSLPLRIALYDNMKSIPRILESSYGNIRDFIEDASQKTYNLSHQVGGKIPYTTIREIVENLIHADFNEIVITILDGGNHIIVSDQGPGVEDKEKAFLPGYTSATTSMKEYIRGVGSGLPIVKETMTFSGGSIKISDNIKKGTVISLKLEQEKNPDINVPTYFQDALGANPGGPVAASSPPKEPQADPEHFDSNVLTNRQKKILFLILELEEAGPSKIAKELGFSLSTSYRELIFLENKKLLLSGGSGKRRLSKKGSKYLEYYSNNI
ncbi:MAG: histidine kinase [Actinobacteria bacterium]|nr:histidine kinase [Actinomycetota bacterium]